MYVGVGDHPLVGATDEQWDMVALVRYPSRQAFIDFVRDPEYRAVAHLRAEALAATVLQPTDELG